MISCLTNRWSIPYTWHRNSVIQGAIYRNFHAQLEPLVLTAKLPFSSRISSDPNKFKEIKE